MEKNLTFIDEQGNKYDRLTVVSRAPSFRRGDKHLAQWNCVCDCGVSCLVLGTDLRQGHRKSCGCLKREQGLKNCLISAELRKGIQPENSINEVGNRYGRLTVINQLPSRHRKSRWECRCDCGKRKRATGDSLRQGKVASCGCLRRNVSNERTVSNKVKFSQYQSNALRRKLSFELTFEAFVELLSFNCLYCGGIGGGIDRWDNSLGYIIQNSVPCCTICNRMKLTHSPFEFLVHCRRVVENHKNATAWNRQLPILDNAFGIVVVRDYNFWKA